LGMPRGGGRKRERRGREVSSQTTGPEWLWAARSKATARARGGGGLANRGGQRGAADRWGRATTGPGVSDEVREEEG
jgi:hypothetical protein